MIGNQSEYAAELAQELDNENVQANADLTPAEHWEKIMQIAKSLENDVQDLKDIIGAAAFTFDENGKMIINV